MSEVIKPWLHLNYDQTDLPRLCRDWDIRPREYHVYNQLYGFDRIVREYAGLPDEPLPWTMEHFISFGDPQPFIPDVQSRLPFRLAVTEEQAEALRRHVRVPVHAIGSSFFYMQDQYHRQHGSADSQRCGTLVFPDKSTMGKDTDFDRDRFARELAALPDEFQPITISIYWKDFCRGTHRPFEDAGLKLVTSGHSFDPLFLFRQYELCRQYRYACANDLSTSFCMAVLAGCRFFHWPSGPLQITVNDVIQVHEQEPTMRLPGKQACLAASLFPPLADRTHQVALAEEFAGKRHIRLPEFFRELFAEGQRRLVTQARPQIDISFKHRWTDHVDWQARGIDEYGWTISECRFDVAPRPGYAGVRLRIVVKPRTSKDWRGEWVVQLDDESHPIVVSPGRWLLEIPCRTDGQPRRVSIVTDREIPHNNDPRCRAFRIKDITWRRRLSGQLCRRVARWHPAYSRKSERFWNRLRRRAA